MIKEDRKSEENSPGQRESSAMRQPVGNIQPLNGLVEILETTYKPS
jgi:hypothetical protein